MKSYKESVTEVGHLRPGSTEYIEDVIKTLREDFGDYGIERAGGSKAIADKLRLKHARRSGQ